MTVYEALAAANADGDYPTAQDLADGLGRNIRPVMTTISALRAKGHVRAHSQTIIEGARRTLRTRWEVTGTPPARRGRPRRGAR